MIKSLSIRRAFNMIKKIIYNMSGIEDKVKGGVV